MKIYKTKKGYFYKEYKNGKKKRISKEEYQKLKTKNKPVTKKKSVTKKKPVTKKKFRQKGGVKRYCSTCNEQLGDPNELFSKGRTKSKHHCRICIKDNKEIEKSYFCADTEPPCGRVFDSPEGDYPICNGCMRTYNIVITDNYNAAKRKYQRAIQRAINSRNVVEMKRILSDRNKNKCTNDELLILYNLLTNSTDTIALHTNNGNNNRNIQSKLLLLIYKNIKENLSFYEIMGIVSPPINNQSNDISLTPDFMEKLIEHKDKKHCITCSRSLTMQRRHQCRYHGVALHFYHKSNDCGVILNRQNNSRETDLLCNFHRNNPHIDLIKAAGWTIEMMLELLSGYGISSIRYSQDSKYIESKLLELLDSKPELIMRFRNKNINETQKTTDLDIIKNSIKPALKAVLVLPKHSLSWLQTILLQDKEFFTFDEEVKGFKLLAATYFKYPGLFENKINSHKTRGTRSNFEDQYGRKFTEHTCKDLIFGNLTNDFTNDDNKVYTKSVLDPETLELYQSKRTEIITQKSALEEQIRRVQEMQNSNAQLGELGRLGSQYIPLLKQLMQIDARLQNHYFIFVESESSTLSYSRRLIQKYQIEKDIGQYTTFFKKINGNSPLQFSTLVTDYTEEESGDDSTRICCFASGLARLILAIDLYKTYNLAAYIELQNEMIAGDQRKSTQREFNYQIECNTQFDRILLEMKLNFETIATADTHALSIVKTIFHRFTNTLPQWILSATDFIGITNPFTQKFNAIKFT